MRVFLLLICCYFFQLSYSKNYTFFGIKASPIYCFSFLSSDVNYPSSLNKYYSKSGIMAGGFFTVKGQNKLSFSSGIDFLLMSTGYRISSDYTFEKIVYDLRITTLNYELPFSIEYKIIENNKKHYRAFISSGIKLAKIQYFGGLESVQTVDFEEHDLNEKDLLINYKKKLYNSSLILGIKFLTAIKKKYIVDYGFSFQYFINSFPKIYVKQIIENEEYPIILTPRIGYLCLNLNYYLISRKKIEKKMFIAN